MKVPKRVYLDYAAATPLDPIVEAAMAPYQALEFANPSSLYAEGRAARLALEGARKRVAKVLGARAGEIVFTAGGTEAINLSIQGTLKIYPQGKIVVCVTEHQAVLACVSQYKHDLLTVKHNGKVKLDELEAKINDDTVMVCVAAVNGELGTIQPISDAAAVIAKVRVDRKSRGVELPLYLACDGSAAAGHVSLQVSRTGVDLLVINSGKLYGPKQSAALYVRAGTKLDPVILGGGQERGLRSGSEAVGQAIGLATALELAEQKRPGEERRYHELHKGLMCDLEQIPEFNMNNPQHSLPGTINFRIDGTSGDDLVYKLDAAGFAVATGAACAASNYEPSHVLLAIGLTRDQANASLRLSCGRSTMAADLSNFAKALKSLV